MSTPNTPGSDRPESSDPASWAPPSSSWQDPGDPQEDVPTAPGAQGPDIPSPDTPVAPPAADAWDPTSPVGGDALPATPPPAGAWGPSPTSWGETPDPGTTGWGAPGQVPSDPAPGGPGQGGTEQGGTGQGSTGVPGGPAGYLPGSQGPQGPSWMPSPQPGVIPLRPLQIGDLFDGTFRTIRANPAVMFGFSVALLAILSLIGAALEAAFSNSFYSVLDDPQAAIDNDLTGTASGIAGMIVSNLGTTALTVLASTILSGILALTVSDAVLGRVTSLGEAWARVRPRIWALIGTSLLVSVITSVAALVVIAVFSIPVIVAATSGTGISAGSALPMLIGVPLALVLVLFLSVRLLFSPMTVVLEDLGPLAALRRSWELTSGGFWRVCGRLILIALISGVAAGLIGGAVGMFGALFMFISSPALGVALTTFLTGVASGLVVPITAAFETLMYVDERMRRENLAPVLARAAQDG